MQSICGSCWAWDCDQCCQWLLWWTIPHADWEGTLLRFVSHMVANGCGYFHNLVIWDGQPKIKKCFNQVTLYCSSMNHKSHIDWQGVSLVFWWYIPVLPSHWRTEMWYWSNWAILMLACDTPSHPWDLKLGPFRITTTIADNELGMDLTWQSKSNEPANDACIFSMSLHTVFAALAKQ